MVKSDCRIVDGERLKLVGKAFEEGPSFIAHIISTRKIDDFNFDISFKVPKTAQVGDFVFKVSLPTISFSKTKESNREVFPKNDVWRKIANEKLTKIYAKIGRSLFKNINIKKPVFRLEVWGKLRPQINIPSHTELVIDFREDVENLSKHIKKKVILSLPPIVIETEWYDFQKRVNKLLAKSFERWQIGHLS